MPATILIATIPPEFPGYELWCSLGITKYDDLSNIVGVVGALAAAVVFMVQFGISIHQRGTEQRRTRAALARELLDRLFSDTRSRDALRMLDWKARTYAVSGQPIEISECDVKNGLRIEAQRPCPRNDTSSQAPPSPAADIRLSFTTEEQYVRDCFECLFDQSDILEHFVDRGLLDFDDLRPPLEYYAKKINALSSTFSPFLNEYEYKLTTAFLKRFPC